MTWLRMCDKKNLKQMNHCINYQVMNTHSVKKIWAQPGKIVIQVTIKAKKCSGRQEQPQNYFSATIHMTKVIKR